MSHQTRERLLLLAAGASLAVAVLLLLRPGQARGSAAVARSPRAFEPLASELPEPSTSASSAGPQPAWRSFGDGLRDEWAEWMERRTPPEVDPQRVRSHLVDLPGGGDVQVGLLAPGIVEVVGTVPGPDEIRGLLAAAAGEPGVRRVVNRLWIQGDVE